MRALASMVIVVTVLGCAAVCRGQTIPGALPAAAANAKAITGSGVFVGPSGVPAMPNPSAPMFTVGGPVTPVQFMQPISPPPSAAAVGPRLASATPNPAPNAPGNASPPTLPTIALPNSSTASSNVAAAATPNAYVLQPLTVAPPQPPVEAALLNNSAPVFVTVAPPSQPSGWIGGAGVYVLKPHWTAGNDSAFITRTANTTGVYDRTTTDFNYSYQASPAVWFGHVNEMGNGVRASFFQYYQFASASATVTPGTALIDPFAVGTAGTGIFTSAAGGQFTANSNLQILSWDLEGLKRWTTGGWTWLGSAGLRYLYLNQAYGADIQPYTDAGAFSHMEARHFFNGCGPTVAMQGRRALDGTGFGLFGGGRAALLFGKAYQSYVATIPDTTASQENSASGWGVLPFAEVEVGADYRRSYGNGMIIFENSMVGQAYFGAGSLSNASPLDGSQSYATLGMFGLRSSISFIY
ncbi:MAG TPA: Lpg1974 family pore-forming outer membrane protein [Pirellulales bacterium]|nr:Lpg1974 family pore-forming outer membrane protein [Pirellulales bacterium]